MRNEATLAALPRVPPPDPGYLDTDRVRSLLGVADGDPLAVGLYLMAYLRLRRGEALGLSWADVDPDARTLYVRRNLVRVANPVGGWRLVLSEPETAKSRRHLGIPAPLGDILAAHRRDQQRLALLVAMPRPGCDSPVVATGDGGRADPDNFTKCVVRMGKRAGIPALATLFTGDPLTVRRGGNRDHCRCAWALLGGAHREHVREGARRWEVGGTG